MNKKIVTVLTGFALITSVLYGQDNPLELSLDEAVDYAMQNNKTLQNAKDDVKIAEEEYKNSRSSGLPSVEGAANYTTNFNYEVEFGMGGSSTTNIQYPQGPLESGEEEVFNYVNSLFSSLGGSSTITMGDQVNANVQVSQLIFSGQYWVGLQLAKLAKSMRETSLKSTELDIKEQVKNAYYMILISERLMSVIDKNKIVIEEIYTHTNNMYKVGMAEQTDVDQIRINLSQLENSKKEMERNIQLSYNSLRFILGLQSTSNIDLKDNLDNIIKSIEQNSLLSDSLNITNNPTYQLMESQVELGEKQVDLQKWACAPTIAGYYSYTEKIVTSGFDLSPNNSAGISLSLPIFSGGARKAQISKAKIELDKSKRDKSLFEEQLQLQNKQLTFELKNAYDNYLLQKDNVDVAQRVFTSFQNKYKQGVISSLELTQANGNYLQAESNYVSSVMTFLQAKLSLDKLYNNL